MRQKKLLVSVGTAVAALRLDVSYAANPPVEEQQDSSGLKNAHTVDAKLADPVLQRLKYQIGEQAHALTLHRSLSGVMYAQHESHASHRSHSDHYSHRSGS